GLRPLAPRRARVQLRGRPISEKALVMLECNEAFENTELSPWNDCIHLPDRLQGSHFLENQNAGPVKCNALLSRDPAVFAQRCRLAIASIQIGAKGEVQPLETG